jgi:hypothetical protein
VYALVTTTPVTLAFALGLASAGRELYLGNHAPLLLATPVSSRRIVLRAFLRMWVGWCGFGLAFALPAITALTVRASLAPAPVLGVALAVAVFLAPVVAGLVLAKVVLVRWCSGPRLRLLAQVAQVAFAAGVVLALLLGIVRGDELAARVSGPLRVPAAVAWPGALPAALAGHAQAPAAWALLCACPAIGALLLLAAAGLYRRSFERHLLVGSRRALRARSRAWPVDPMRSLLAKASAESLRMRGNLVFFAFLCALLVAGIATSAPAERDGAPRAVAEAFLVLRAWQGVSLLMAMILFLGVIGDDQKQIALLATAPVSRRDVLRARRIVLAWPFAAMLLLAAVTAPPLRGVSLAGAFGFALAAFPLLLATLGCVLALGSWPAMIRVHADTPLASNLRSALPSILVGSAGVAALVATTEARAFLTHAYRWGWRGWDADLLTAGFLAAAWLAGLAAYGVGARIARGNFERLLGPQPE